MGKWEEKRVFEADDGTEFRRVDADEVEESQYCETGKSHWYIDNTIVSESAMMDLVDTLRSEAAGEPSA